MGSTVAMLVPAGLAIELLVEHLRSFVHLSRPKLWNNAEALLIGLCKCLVGLADGS